MGAEVTAVVQPLILAVGSDWAYTIVELSYVLFLPYVLSIMLRVLENDTSRHAWNVWNSDACIFAEQLSNVST